LVTVLTKRALRAILSNRTQFIAITIIVALGTSLCASLNIACENLSTSYNYVYEKLKLANFRVLINPVDRSILITLEKVSNVRDIEGRPT